MKTQQLRYNYDVHESLCVKIVSDGSQSYKNKSADKVIGGSLKGRQNIIFIVSVFLMFSKQTEMSVNKIEHHNDVKVVVYRLFPGKIFSN